MAVSTTPRRALHDLPVNAHWIPSINLPTSSNNNMKRNIAEVEEPAASPVPSRLRLSEHTKPLQIKPSYPHFAPEMKMALEETCKEASQGTIAEGMQDGTVEESTQETTISPIEDSDSEGDTLNTQQTTATELSQATDTVQLSHAERLRLRLRIALFKVQTNQTNIPISQLCIPGHGSLGESVSQNDTPQPTLLPAPVLKSAVRPPQTIRQSGVLSSPPDPSETSPVKRSSPEIFRTPALPRHQDLSPQALNSTPDGRGGGSREVEAEHSGLSSSAVKGSAARSLLGLREERR